MLKSELVRTTTKTTIAMKTMKTLLTPEEDPMPEDPNPPWDPKVSRPWSLLPSPHKARAPFRESIEGVGDVISPDFCLTWDIMSSDLIYPVYFLFLIFKKVTMPRLAGPSKVDDPRSPILASPHTWKEGFLLQENSAFCRLRPNKERKERDKNCCVCKEGLSVHWVGGWAA